MFSEEQICYTNTTLDDIWGVHPQICVFLLQSFCLKSYNQNNNNNSDKNPHKLLVVLQLSTRDIPVTFSSICTEIKQEKLKNAVHESWKLFMYVHCSDEDEGQRISSTQLLIKIITCKYKSLFLQQEATGSLYSSFLFSPFLILWQKANRKLCSDQNTPQQ